MKTEKVYASRFLNVYDMPQESGMHYINASRRDTDDLVASKSDEEFKTMLPDAVSCFVVLDEPGKEPRLLLSNEYRYPIGQYLLSVPAGLIDKEDKGCDDAIIRTATREVKEETGIECLEGDECRIVSPLVFSTPGMTDESNGLVLIVIHRDVTGGLSQDGAVGSEKFDGFVMPNKEEALKLLQSGRDSKGIFYSAYTWMALMYFVSDMWRKQQKGGT